MSKQVTNKQQMAKLVNIMQNDEVLAKGILSKNMREERWQIIANQLNCLGPPIKTWDKWYRVWTDIKAKVKGKLAHNKSELRSTGGGPNNIQTLSPLEEDVANLLNLRACINPPGREFSNRNFDKEVAASETENNLYVGASTSAAGRKRISNEMEASTAAVDVYYISDAEDSELQVNKENESQPTKRARRNNSQKPKSNYSKMRINLLEQQTKNQQDFHLKITNEIEKVVGCVTANASEIAKLTSAVTKMVTETSNLTSAVRELIQLQTRKCGEREVVENNEYPDCF